MIVANNSLPKLSIIIAEEIPRSPINRRILNTRIRNENLAPFLLQGERRIRFSSRSWASWKEGMYCALVLVDFTIRLYVRIAIRFIYTGRKSVNEKSRSQLARLFAVKRGAVGFLLDCLC